MAVTAAIPNAGFRGFASSVPAGKDVTADTDAATQSRTGYSRKRCAQFNKTAKKALNY